MVARCEDDLKILDELMERGEKNGVKNLRVVGREELRRMEPGIAEEAIAALYSPDAGTVTPYVQCCLIRLLSFFSLLVV